MVAAVRPGGDGHRVPPLRAARSGCNRAMSAAGHPDGVAGRAAARPSRGTVRAGLNRNCALGAAAVETMIQHRKLGGTGGGVAAPQRQGAQRGRATLVEGFY